MTTTISNPRPKTRQARTLAAIKANSLRGYFTYKVRGTTRLQLLDDISRLRAKGWNFETNRSRKYGRGYRLTQ